MKTEYKKVKIEFVDKTGTKHNVGEDILVLPEASNDKQYCIGIDVGIVDYVDRIHLDYVDEEYLANRKKIKRSITIYDSYYDQNGFIEINDLIELLKYKKDELNKKNINDISVVIDYNPDNDEYQIIAEYYEDETEDEYNRRMLSDEMRKQRQIDQMKSLINGNFEEAINYINTLKEKKKTL